MLRRVARVFRVGLLLLGIAVVAWSPVSWDIGIELIVPFRNEADNAGLLLVEWGQAKVAILPHSFQYGIMGHPFALGLQVYRPTFGPLIKSSSPWGIPSVTRDLGVPVLALPLWLLAFLCLAWPVSSFIIHRRKYKRGFPVEPAASTPLPRAGEVPSESASEAERV